MTQLASTTRKPRKHHTLEFPQEALKLAERIGVLATGRELILYRSGAVNSNNSSHLLTAKMNSPLKMPV
ncbi:hypothetical protein KG487_004588 [Salmonella enterica subsp. enterica serovar 4,5,12:b:-]|nr:hypothetical protein [Salmonella enterica]EHF1448373.1 hypothetical protein [Salmonella enterica subsp. enterica serovar 4,5,12:b:-]EHG1528583.1 hypothetical protein [Salmonella enterica subsp. enterica serovar 4,[5],12:b:-]EFB0477337.1 hypothetical protein [Salmonella enterica]EFQ4600511.1 hypothetical protein [Salmonella enterica]